MKIVNNLSLRLGIVRAAIIAGIAQANPDSIGTKDLPFNPIFDKGLSIADMFRYPTIGSLTNYFSRTQDGPSAVQRGHQRVERRKQLRKARKEFQ